MKDKDILCNLYAYELKISENDKAPLFTFYKDGTYRVSHWDKNEFSGWEIRDSTLWVFHTVGGTLMGSLQQGTWLRCGANEVPYGPIIVERLEMELVELELLGVDIKV